MSAIAAEETRRWCAGEDDGIPIEDEGVVIFNNSSGKDSQEKERDKGEKKIMFFEWLVIERRGCRGN